jgi:hypothetical protein
MSKVEKYITGYVVEPLAKADRRPFDHKCCDEIAKKVSEAIKVIPFPSGDDILPRLWIRVSAGSIRVKVMRPEDEWAEAEAEDFGGCVMKETACITVRLDAEHGKDCVVWCTVYTITPYGGKTLSILGFIKESESDTASSVSGIYRTSAYQHVHLINSLPSLPQASGVLGHRYSRQHARGDTEAGEGLHKSLATVDGLRTSNGELEECKQKLLTDNRSLARATSNTQEEVRSLREENSRLKEQNSTLQASLEQVQTERVHDTVATSGSSRRRDSSGSDADFGWVEI